MNESKIAGRIKKGAAIKLVLSLLLLATAALLIYCMAISGILSMDGYLQPYDVCNSLGNIDDIAHKPIGLDVYAISITAASDNVVDAGIRETEDNNTTGYYIAIFVDEKYVFCKLSPRAYENMTVKSSYTFTGTLRNLESKVVSLAVEDMAKENISERDAKEMIYSYIIDTTENGIAPRSMLYAFTLFLLAAGLWLFVGNLLTMANIKHYSQIKKLSKYGDAESLYEEIEQEYAMAENETYSLGKGRGWVCLTGRWVIVLLSFSVKFMRAEDLMWAYKHKQTTKSYGITTNVSFFLKLRSRDKTLTVVGKEQYVDEVLAAIFKKYPQVVVGYSAALEPVFKNNKEQFASYADESHSAMQ